MSEAKKLDNQQNPKFIFIGSNRRASDLKRAVDHSLDANGLGIIVDQQRPNLISHMLKTPLPEFNRDPIIHPGFVSGTGKTYQGEKKPCGHKTAFADQNTADEYLRQIKRTAKLKNQKKFPTHSYLCPHCLAWHLTSKHQFRLEEILQQKEDKIKELKTRQAESKTHIADLKFDLSEAKRRIAELSAELRKKDPEKHHHPPSG